MVRVNLLPIRDILRKRELKQFLLLTAVIVASTFGLMVCTAVFFSWKISTLEKDKTVHETKLNQLKEKNKEIEELKNRIARLQRQVDTIEKTNQDSRYSCAVYGRRCTRNSGRGMGELDHQNWPKFRLRWGWGGQHRGGEFCSKASEYKAGFYPETAVGKSRRADRQDLLYRRKTASDRCYHRHRRRRSWLDEFQNSRKPSLRILPWP